jgi:hypothetical protein
MDLLLLSRVFGLRQMQVLQVIPLVKTVYHLMQGLTIVPPRMIPPEVPFSHSLMGQTAVLFIYLSTCRVKLI